MTQKEILRNVAFAAAAYETYMRRMQEITGYDEQELLDESNGLADAFSHLVYVIESGRTPEQIEEIEEALVPIPLMS